jgi:hypothetical protein
MIARNFDDLGRCASPVLNRRLSLAALGLATLAAMNQPANAGASKAGRKARKKCKRQRGPCAAFVRADCGTNQACLDNTLPCCDLLGRCNFAAFAACFEANI